MKQVDFDSDNISKNVMLTAVPMLVAQVLHLLYSIVDRIYIGRIPGIGTSALGGIGLCFPVIILITAFTNLYGSGGAPLCAISLGKKDLPNAEKIMNLAFTLLCITAASLFLLGELFARPLLILFGASGQNIGHAVSYLRIYLIGTLFSMTASGMNPYINAQGFPGIGMLTVTIGAVSNIILDPVFIFLFRLGIQGAAVATVLSQALSAFFVLKFLTGPSPQLKLRRFSVKTLFGQSRKIKNMLSLGLSSFIMQFTNSMVQVACNGMLSHLGGDIYVSIMTIISSVRQIVDTPIMAVGDGASPIISYNYGARQPDRIRRIIRFITILALAYTLIMWGAVFVAPAFFIRIFSSDRELLKTAIPALHTYFFAYSFQTLQYVGQTTFKSLNKKKRAIFFSLFRKVVMVIPLTFLLPTVFRMGVAGVFAAEPVSNVIGGTACFTTMLLTILPELKAMEESNKTAKKNSRNTL